MMRFESVGRWYESRVSHATGASHSSVENSSDEEDAGSGGLDESATAAGEIDPLLLDPTQWKVNTVHWCRGDIRPRPQCIST